MRLSWGCPLVDHQSHGTECVGPVEQERSSTTTTSPLHDDPRPGLSPNEICVGHRVFRHGSDPRWTDGGGLLQGLSSPLCNLLRWFLTGYITTPLSEGRKSGLREDPTKVYFIPKEPQSGVGDFSLPQVRGPTEELSFPKKRVRKGGRWKWEWYELDNGRTPSGGGWRDTSCRFRNASTTCFNRRLMSKIFLCPSSFSSLTNPTLPSPRQELKGRPRSGLLNKGEIGGRHRSSGTVLDSTCQLMNDNSFYPVTLLTLEVGLETKSSSFTSEEEG